MPDARVLHRLILLFIIAGIGFSSFAAFEVLYPPLQGVCSLSIFFSCGRVTESGHTAIGPIQDWVVGLGGFLLLLAIDIPLIRSFDARWLLLLFVVALVGVGVAIYLAYVELYVINALCPICLGAYLADAAVAILAGLLILTRPKRGTVASV